jgi:hypothetical protein
MITEEEVITLYRSLLGRDPEGIDTIRAFRSYYPSVERGRRAIFTSDEFEFYFASVTGKTPSARDDLAGGLALALLERAVAAAPPFADPPHEDAAMRAAMAQFFAEPEFPRFAVAVGQPDDLRLDDLAPLGRREAAVLQIIPGLPPVLPLTSRLADGTTVFRLGGDAATVGQFLTLHRRRIDALYLLDRPAGRDWVEALQPFFAPRTLLAVGRSSDRFDAGRLSAAIATAIPSEPVQEWQGLRLHHLGGWLLPVSYEPPVTLPPPPDKTAYPSLAIAAIVRDEAASIANMLQSVLPVASFVALLDTGSTDGTVAVAQDFLDRAGIRFRIAQRDRAALGDDFSAMRNAALDLVPDRFGWVLMLDADEELAAEDGETLLRLIADGTHDAYALPRYNFPGTDKQGRVLLYPDRQIRLLRHRRTRRLRYAGAVHETVKDVAAFWPPLDASAMGGDRGGPHIHHLVRRYRSPEEEARKQVYYREITRRVAEGG